MSDQGLMFLKWAIPSYQGLINYCDSIPCFR